MSPVSRAVGLRIFAVFALGYFLSYMFRALGALIGPELARELSLGEGALGLLASTYFLAFFVAQAPIGIAMDRFGPARVNATLFLVAAAGSAVFALGHDVFTLAAGRAMIGLGVAGALMTSFKAFVIWYEAGRREALTGAITAVGGFAAMLAASPTEWLMRQTDWRVLFWGLAAACVAAATLLVFAVPADGGQGPGAAGGAQGGFATVLRSRIFAGYAPLAFFGSGGFSAVQSLWAGPWLIEVAGLSRAAVADVLFAYGFALLAGYLLISAVGAPLQRVPEASRRWYVGSLGVAALSLAVIVSNRFAHSVLPWMAYGLTLGATMLAYPALTRAFPAAIAGRVVTSYNMVMFLGAFVIQWGIGALIQTLVAAGVARPAAYQWAFAGLLAAQVLSLGWFVRMSRRA